jgi:ectoine hydroxylase-related dioxygenase (phytanoyl-CoA dioxygenase family)
MTEFIDKLDRNGYVVLENIFSPLQINKLKENYINGWEKIKGNWDNLQWKTRIYNEDCQKNMAFIGTDLYNGQKYADYENYGIIDMGKGRYDFCDITEKLGEIPTKLDNLMKSKLQFEYDHYIGGLPVDSKVKVNSNGLWHRDVYSLYDNEKYDILLPSFYYTVLIPLEDVDENDVTTEFVTGSHKFNLRENNIDTKEKVIAWCDKQDLLGNVKSIALKSGSVCVFDGLTIHRGRAAKVERDHQRLMIYAVFKKNWYNDEPESSYTQKFI